MNNNTKRGYLFFASQFPDEFRAQFIPETEEELIKELKAVDSARSLGEAHEKVTEWINKIYQTPDDQPEFRTQTRCYTPWPFNEYTILGTFYSIDC